MKLGVIFTMIFGIILLAYISASSKKSSSANLSALRLQMTEKEVEKSFGSPFARERNTMTYILEDSSELSITLRDNSVASAIVRFHKPLRIGDPQHKQLTLVQMAPGDVQNENPSWFFAGKPEEGLIYKITQSGSIESLTWVPPFTYSGHQKKNLQALLNDFKSQHTSSL